MKFVPPTAKTKSLTAQELHEGWLENLKSEKYGMIM